MPKERRLSYRRPLAVFSLERQLSSDWAWSINRFGHVVRARRRRSTVASLRCTRMSHATTTPVLLDLARKRRPCPSVKNHQSFTPVLPLASHQRGLTHLNSSDLTPKTRRDPAKPSHYLPCVPLSPTLFSLILPSKSRIRVPTSRLLRIC